MTPAWTHALVGPVSGPTARCGVATFDRGSWQPAMVTCPVCLTRLQQSRAPAAGPPVAEHTFQQQVIDLARLHGWLAYHPWTSVASAAGFPDTTMVHPVRHELLFWELKVDAKQPSAAQTTWLAALQHIQTVDARVLWPTDWPWLTARLQSPAS